MNKFKSLARYLTNISQKSPIKITDNASIKIKNICKQAKVNHLYFYASGGGCGGFKYNLILNDEIDKKDIKITQNNATVYVDHFSEMKILGTTIDYEEANYDKGVIEGGFKYIPQKDFATMCGCGISFAPKKLT